MKVEICNLGIIRQAKINLKPLTVFIGENGTGKTRTAYTLASIFDLYGYEKYIEAFFAEKSQQIYQPFEEAFKQLLEEGNAKIDLVDFAESHLELYINDIASLAYSWIPEFMNTTRVEFKELKLNLNIDESKRYFLQRILSIAVENKLSASYRTQEALLNAVKENQKRDMYFYTTSGLELFKKLPMKTIKRFLFQSVFEVFHEVFYPHIYIFPVERSTFMGLPLNQIKNKNLSVPIERFMEMIENASFKIPSKRKKEIENNPEIANHLGLANILEKDILQGKVNIETSDIKTEFLFEVLENLNIELSISSSIVKELTPLVLCLRYLAQPNDLIIIDEPEMNLHPAAQVEIIEFLAMLVQAGLNVLITTHSPYIVDHLSNLMRAAKYEDKESIRERFYLERTEAFIPQEQVSVYLFEDGTAKNILSEDGRIDWGTFADVSDDISRILP